MNPILPIQHFVPDAEARLWQDGRLYLYGSYDISGRTSYCSWEYRVFSSDDLLHWQDHGQSFRSTPPHASLDWTRAPLYAPDCIYHNGRYYLFFCDSNGREGVAESHHPAGPFTDAHPVVGADGDGIDPAALVDDDGQVYYYWGQFHLRGAKLQVDLRAIQPDTLHTALLTEAEHGFHEGASIRKRGDLYYLVYTDISRGRATSLAYAVSSSPLGPFTKGGIIIDNTGCDPETWNNHGSIAEFKGNWYVFYHRSSQASNFNRRVCVEPIRFNAGGGIDEVEMTTQGVSGPLPAGQHMEAWRACLLGGTLRTAAAGPTEHDPAIREYLTHIHHGDWAAFKYIDFDAQPVDTFHARAGSPTYGGAIEIRFDAPDGELAGVCRVPRTGGWGKWQSVSCRVSGARGVRAVYLVFKRDDERFVPPHFDPDRLFDLDSFWFS
jgi:arabinoxylan arabinofuranohydrolase